MCVTGKLNEFKEYFEEFSNYLERFQLDCTANKVADAEEIPLFLNIIDPNS